MSSPTCPTEEQLEAFLAGTMPEGEAEDLSRHVESCRLCEQVIASLERRADELVALLRSPVDRRSEAELTASAYREGLARALRIPDRGARQVKEATPPSHLGRYRVVRTLGSGAFGVVYGAFDERLDRHVVIKVLHPDRCRDSEEVRLLLKEAQILARLDHPGIVKVFDAGQTADGRPFVVFQDVEAVDLSQYRGQNEPSCHETARLAAELADALHFAHQNGIVHRDIKPSNILVDAGGKGYVADFGLALREVDFGSGPGFAGTPAYMSPEQARGEGHRVDGRSDVFSLGVVFYEMLCGRLPFRGDSRRVMLQQIRSTTEARPPRQIVDQLPKELERICLKAIAKRMGDRYTTAKDMADDLRCFLDAAGGGTGAGRTASEESTDRPAEAAGGSRRTGARIRPVTVSNRSSADPGYGSDLSDLVVVPKGLRSFDQSDADFFLGLLPGPRDREGTPESLRFWKNRIEAAEQWQTFPVGVIYGPSGCGKSSFVKAGLLPRLAEDVATVYIEMTPEKGVTTVQSRLRSRFADLPETLSLSDSMAWLRRYGDRHASKTLLVLDQFEQWLHHWDENRDDPLIQALRQCDGSHLQALLVVRDDFWMATTRWMRSVEVCLREGDNCAALDLFNLRHAKNVLAAFGRAYGALPPGERSEAQNKFLQRTVDELSENGRIICLHLVLFALMMEGREWNVSTLESFGGVDQIGVAFLQSTFDGRGAPATCRYHQTAARRVLQSLLPAQRSGITRHVRSRAQLQLAAGYQQRPEDFEQLMQILDGQLRLITPCDAASTGSSTVASTPGTDTSRHYHLTHDFLVPSLRTWLTRKQHETLRGRAELCLAERTQLWLERREPRQLPSAGEWRKIVLLTKWSGWSPAERATMRAATRRHVTRLAIVSAIVLLALAVAWPLRSAWRRGQAETATRALLDAQPGRAAASLEQIPGYPREAENMLRDVFQHSKLANERLRAAVGLARLGDVRWNFFLDAIAWAPQAELITVAEALQPVAAEANQRMFQKLEACLTASERSDADENRQGLQRTAVRCAAMQLYLGDDRGARRCLRLAPDPSPRTQFIATFASCHGDLVRLASLLGPSDDTSFQSGICLSLGTLDPATIPDVQRTEVVRVLRQLFTASSSGAVHSAAGWALRRWAIPLPSLDRATPSSERHWFVNRQGMTMIRIPAGEFDMGEIPDFDELRIFTFYQGKHHVTLTRPFYMSACEVALKCYLAFLADDTYPDAEKPAKNTTGHLVPQHDPLFSPSGDYPMNAASWYDALLFCNWLSRREGRRPCYHHGDGNGSSSPDKKTWTCDFQADGYRLPTEAEWEYACRAGSRTRFSFGNDHRHLAEYAVYGSTRPRPVGSRMPNGWGLFDMHGNMAEWCWDNFENHFVRPPGDVTDPRGPLAGKVRVVRDRPWSYRDFGLFMQGMRFSHDNPTIRDSQIGFRIVCQ